MCKLSHPIPVLPNIRHRFPAGGDCLLTFRFAAKQCRTVVTLLLSTQFPARLLPPGCVYVSCSKRDPFSLNEIDDKRCSDRMTSAAQPPTRFVGWWDSNFLHGTLVQNIKGVPTFAQPESIDETNNSFATLLQPTPALVRVRRSGSSVLWWLQSQHSSCTPVLMVRCSGAIVFAGKWVSLRQW